MNRIICLLGALALGGCMSVKPVQALAEAVNALQGQPLTVVTYTKPDFAAMTYGKAAIGGLIGGAVMISDGNTIVRENDIPDPALEMEVRLAALVTDRLKVSGSTRTANRNAKLDDEESLSRDAGRKGVVMDVETINWSFIYFPLDWTHYRVTLVARARLIDANTGKRIAQAPCQYQSEEKTPPTYDQMLDNKAVLLKSMLATAADICADKMANRFTPNNGSGWSLFLPERGMPRQF
jgi:hypothetical protein